MVCVSNAWPIYRKFLCAFAATRSKIEQKKWIGERLPHVWSFTYIKCYHARSHSHTDSTCDCNAMLSGVSCGVARARERTFPILFVVAYTSGDPVFVSSTISSFFSFTICLHEYFVFVILSGSRCLFGAAGKLHKSASIGQWTWHGHQTHKAHKFSRLEFKLSDIAAIGG